MAIRYIVRRLLQIPVLLVVVSAIIFFSLRLGPFDPTSLLSDVGGDPARIAQIRHDWELDRPLAVQYTGFLRRAAVGDLGRSFQDNRPVMEIVGERLPATIELTIFAMILGTILGVGSGILAAIKRGTWVDGATRTVALLGISIPMFWLGLMAISLFSVELGWLPSGGRYASEYGISSRTGFYFLDGLIDRRLDVIRTSFEHVLLPATVLALFVGGFLARITRATMVETMSQDYMKAAVARGASRRRALVAHGLPNALLPIVTIMGLQVGLLLGGVAIIESVFAYPGMGKLLIDSISIRDFPQIQASILTLAVIYILVNLVVDLLYMVIDPRIRSGDVKLG